MRIHIRTAVSLAALLAAAPAWAQLTTLDVEVTIDQINSADAPPTYHAGTVDHVRIAYDTRRVDPKTHRVALASLAHFINGKWMPGTPADASALDMSREPYRLDFAASVVHGQPIVILFEALSSRMAILSRPDLHVIVAGSYRINPVAVDPRRVTEAP